MYLNKNYTNLKRVANENYSNYVKAKPFPSITFDNFFNDSVLNKILQDFPKNINQSYKVASDYLKRAKA